MPDNITKILVNIGGFVIVIIVAILIFAFLVAKYNKKMTKSGSTTKAVGGGFSLNGYGMCLTLIAGWFIFVAIIFNMHPEWWVVWYGTETFPSSQFWIAQVIVLGTIFALPKEGFLRGSATAALVLAIAFSFHSGFVRGAVKGGVVSGPMTLADQADQKWVMKNNTTGHRYKTMIVVKESGKFIITQYSRFKNDPSTATYSGKCSRKGICNGTFWSEDDVDGQNGTFNFARRSDGSYDGFTLAFPIYGKAKPKKEWVEINLNI